MRGAQGLQHLLVHTRAISYSAAAAAELAPVSAPPGGVLSWFGGRSRLTTPLSEPIPVATSSHYVPPAKQPALATSVLGATKIATIDAPGPLATLALTVEAGSKNETPETSGAAFFLSHLAFKATVNRTTFSLVRELERIGAVPTAVTSREASHFAVTFLKLHVPEATELLFDAVLNPRLNSWEVKDLMEAAQAAAAAAHAQPKSLLPEMIHRAAYEGGLGNAYIPDPSAIGSLDSAAVRSFVSANFAASNMVLSGAGVEHDTIKTLAGPMLASSSAPGAKVASTYVGGGLNVIAPTPESHVALAFEVKGGSSDAKNVATAAVVRVLLSASRESLPWMRKELELVSSILPFAYMYKDSGLLGVMASSSPASASKAVDLLSAKLHGLSKTVADAELQVIGADFSSAVQAAKHLVIGNYQSNLASTPGIAHDIGAQLLAQGKFDAADYVKAVGALTAADVASFVAKTTKSPVTFVSYGSLGTMLRYNDIAKRFG